MRAGAVVCPRCGVQAVTDRDRHQFVVGRVVLDLVDAVPGPVVRVQHRPVAVGEFTPALRLRASGEGTQLGDLVEPPPATLADQRLGEDRRGRGVVILQRWNLIGDDVRVCHPPTVTFF